MGRAPDRQTSPTRPSPARAAQLGTLNAAQTTKLKKLSVVSLAARSKSLSYASLLAELEMPSVYIIFGYGDMEMDMDTYI